MFAAEMKMNIEIQGDLEREKITLKPIKIVKLRISKILKELLLEEA